MRAQLYCEDYLFYFANLDREFIEFKAYNNRLQSGEETFFDELAHYKSIIIPLAR